MQVSRSRPLETDETLALERRLPALPSSARPNAVFAQRSCSRYRSWSGPQKNSARGAKALRSGQEPRWAVSGLSHFTITEQGSSS